MHGMAIGAYVDGACICIPMHTCTNLAMHAVTASWNPQCHACHCKQMPEWRMTGFGLRAKNMDSHLITFPPWLHGPSYNNSEWQMPPYSLTSLVFNWCAQTHSHWFQWTLSPDRPWTDDSLATWICICCGMQYNTNTNFPTAEVTQGENIIFKPDSLLTWLAGGVEN